MGGTAHSDAVKSARDRKRDRVLFRKDNCQGTRHKMTRKAVPELACYRIWLDLVGGGNMNDERVIRGSALCGIDLFCAFAVSRIAAETVNGFGGENYRTAVF